MISSALPSSGDMDPALCDLAGQQVATLALGKREAGLYTVRWDGKDDSGRSLASGVYLYRLDRSSQPGNEARSCPAYR